MTTFWNVSTRSFVAKRAPRPRLTTVFAVALGGALGAAARVFLPWPTMLDTSLASIDPLPSVVVNFIGAALLGLVTGYAAQRQWPDPILKGVTTGFFGAFTTMSAMVVAYSGLTLSQSVIFADSAGEGIFYAGAILAGLAVYIYLVTLTTMATLKLGRRLGRRH